MTYTWHDIGGRMVELCDECGFDARELSGNQDDQQRLDAAYAELERLLDSSDADRRPAAETWSARVCRPLRGGVSGDPGLGCGPYRWRITGGLSNVAACRRAVADVAPRLTEAQRAAVLHGRYPQPVTGEWLLRHLLHDTEHHVLDLRRGYVVLGMADHPEVPFRR